MNTVRVALTRQKPWPISDKSALVEDIGRIESGCVGFSLLADGGSNSTTRFSLLMLCTASLILGIQLLIVCPSQLNILSPHDL